jgi:hypothetical protein
MNWPTFHETGNFAAGPVRRLAFAVFIQTGSARDQDPINIKANTKDGLKKATRIVLRVAKCRRNQNATWDEIETISVVA